MAVQDAELQLKVSLDLAFFRQQLSGLGQAAAGYNVPINVKFDRRSVQNELNALGRNISQRKYRLEVATNISAEIESAKRLAKLLREMPAGSKGVAGTSARGLGQKAFLGIEPNEIKRLYKAAADAGLVSFNESIANNKRKIASELGSVGKDSVAGLLNGLNSQNAQLKKAARSLGNDLLASIKGVLGIASPSREFRKIGEDSGKGFEQGLIRSMEIAEKSATRQLQRMLDRLARMALMAGGMSAAEISRQAGAGIAQRMMPGPSWAATTPSRSPSVGPSSSGRLLAGAPAMRGLPGSVYGEQKRLVGDILSPSLKEVLRGAANAFADAVRTELNSAVRSVQVRDLGRTMRAALSPQRTAGLLSAGVGRAPSVYSTGGIGGESREQMIARRTREAYMRSALREMDVLGGGAGRPASPYSYVNRAARPRGAMVPYSAGGALVPMGGGTGGAVPPRPPSGGGSAGMGGMGSFGRALGGINLPGTGVVREIGNEFAMATKQVLLFGTAYKALAFITSFPAQVGQAVGALQSFNNTLKAISPTADEARASNQFILDIVDRYNVPLQSARDGFTKLYASMAPAGFKGDEIRDLFTGVSQAAATFGMSADKVDRVNYAFAQMASKGQVMSEELKGQLGDVLPGAMGIFAEAAGFKGPDAIQKFSKALEDGAYKGEAMRGLLKNVTVVLTKEFGPGAEGAARTFQGVINRMQNSTQLLYEAFEPVAVGFLNSVVVPLTSGIKTVADGFNAFFTSTQAKTAGGSAFAQELEKLKPAFEGIRANITALMPALQGFGGVLLEVGKVFLQIAANPFVGYLARVYLSVLPLVTIIKVLNLQALIPMIGSLLRAVPAFLTFNSLMLQGNRAGLALKTTTFLLGSTSAVTAGQIRLVGTALLSLGMPAVLLGIGALIERFMMLKGAVDGVRQSTQQMVGSISSLANTGAVKEIKNIGADTQKQIATFKSLQPFVSGGLGNAPQRRLTEDAAKKMEELGLGSFVSRGVTGPYVNDFLNASRIIEERLKGLGKTADSVKEKLPLAEKAAASLAKQAKQGIEPIPEGAGSDKTKQQSLESYYSLQDQLAKNFTQDQLDRMEKEYQARVDRINAEFNLREARANSLQKEAIRFERQMSDVELKRQKALLDASAEVIRAQGSVAGGVQGLSTSGVTGLLQGSTGISSGAHFDVRRQDGGYISPDQARALFDPSVRRQLSMTSAYGPRRAPVPGASTFHRGVDLAGPANTPLNLAPGFTMVGAGEKGGLGYAASVRGPGGEMYDVGHLQRPRSGVGAPRKVPGSEKRDIVADQKAQLAVAQQSVAVQIAEAQAIRDAAVAWAEYTNAITPIEEQKLQNNILAKKNELVKLGMPDDVIEKEMKQFETQQKTALAVDVVNKMLNEKKISAEDAAAKIAELNRNMETYNNLLGDNLALQNQQKFDASMGALRKQMELAGILDPRAELRARIAQEKPGYTPQQVEEEAAFQEQIEAATKARDQLRNIASSIGDAFGTAFKSIVTGSSSAREALAGMFQSIADSFADMVAQMIAEWLKAQLIKGFMSLFPGGGAAGAGLGSAASNLNQYAPLVPMANGGVLSGGFRAFANGGIVTGPTLGLVGEGRYNEAVIPLPDGKSVPVDLGGAMGNQITSNIVVNVSSDGKTSSSGAGSDSAGLGRKLEGAVKQVIVDELRPGGLLSGRR
jgi:tape measure domain-containing protein